ncbi:hypothetical protein SAMD00020551_1540 [Mesobacillus selenatarsenatis SF-1]|uniref:Uncharacterized protein n=1 Tax=Mesobacillus selenatarsenatis (strain DSM 18680 / JCM 14380 / FERM P-15431 / SF-1) TaxID=1321606 RepID=A0A0A8X330_MESS1|nr:hypothetical protein [Mesobacillus selenatarsenatis]GAM13397.1 hypothetical protein SAMD00020551_1540 [Mesobacillus selenatarsenatis SF-1]
MQGIYFPGNFLSIVNYISTVFAAILYIIIFVKFHKANKAEIIPVITNQNVTG